MKRFLPALLPALLAGISIGCAQTRVMENGKTVFATQCNAQHLVYRSPAGSYLEITGMDHSSATTAQGNAASQVIGATSGFVGAVGAAVATHGILH